MLDRAILLIIIYIIYVKRSEFNSKCVLYIFYIVFGCLDFWFVFYFSCFKVWWNFLLLITFRNLNISFIFMIFLSLFLWWLIFIEIWVFLNNNFPIISLSIKFYFCDLIVISFLHFNCTGILYFLILNIKFFLFLWTRLFYTPFPNLFKYQISYTNYIFKNIMKRTYYKSHKTYNTRNRQ